MLQPGDTAPAISIPDKDDKVVSLTDYRGKWVVLYFYPKDNTSGCTLEALDFSAMKDEFGRLGAEVVGVSVDSTKSHRGFAEKHDLSITLLSDAERTAVADWGVWGKKKLYGKEYEGTMRTTFLIDPEGTIREVWRNVKVKDHAAAVLQKLKALH